MARTKKKPLRRIVMISQALSRKIDTRLNLWFSPIIQQQYGMRMVTWRLLLLCCSWPYEVKASAVTTGVSFRRISRRHGSGVWKEPPVVSSSPLAFIQDSTTLCRRGGGGGGADAAAKTMTARQMEAFNLVSGGLAGTVASCLTNPLEVIKTQLQSSWTAQGVTSRNPWAVTQRIWREDGISGFFRGLPPTLIGIIPSRSAYFYAYQRSKVALSRFFPEGSPPNALFSGLIAGIAGNTLTSPIWMVRTRMQLLADTASGQIIYKGYGDVIRTIFREEGIPGFYRGIQASYWGCTEGALQFILYEQFKTRLLRRANHQQQQQQQRAKHHSTTNKRSSSKTVAIPTRPITELGPWTYFWSAALAKLVATVMTYPHEVARTRMREQARAGIFKYNGMWQTMNVIWKEEGFKALYGGCAVHLLKVVPNSAFMFLTYELVRRWLSEFTIVDNNTSTTR